MKKTVIISVIALLSVSFLLGGCGKSPKEEYADLCKKYEPYNAQELYKKIFWNKPKGIEYTEAEHKLYDEFKKKIIESDKIYNEIKTLVDKNPADLKKDFDWTFIVGKQRPEISKERFNRFLKDHKNNHKGCTYDFKF